MSQLLRRLGMVTPVSGSMGMLFYAYLYFSETNNFPALENVKGYAAGFLAGGIAGSCVYYTNRYFDRLLPWKNYFTARFITGYFLNVAIVLAIISSFTLAFIYARESTIFWDRFSLQDDDVALKAIILTLVTIFIYKVVYALQYSYQQYTVAQIENLQRERKQLELQFEALKSQISPHYLFNSLNTISSLIYKDPQSAEQFIRRLAQTYQYILSTQHKQYVSLKEEVDFVQSYYYLLRIRFQQQLKVEINLPSGIMHTKIPPLTLQILVENAVKHNHLGADKQLFIYITAQDNTHLRVINTKTGSLSSIESFHMGLENIRKRYEYFTDRKIEIRDEEKFTVSLPVIDRMEHKFSA